MGSTVPDSSRHSSTDMADYLQRSMTAASSPYTAQLRQEGSQLRHGADEFELVRRHTSSAQGIGLAEQPDAYHSATWDEEGHGLIDSDSELDAAATVTGSVWGLHRRWYWRMWKQPQWRNREAAARAAAMTQCRAAEKLLHQLTQAKRGWTDLLPTMPKSAIKYSVTVALLHVTKAGAGFGYAYGTGFVLTKLKEVGCMAKWSAPLFVKQSQPSLGLTLGYTREGRVWGSMTSRGVLDTLFTDKWSAGVDRAWIMEYSDSAQQVRSKGHGHMGSRLLNADGQVVAKYYVKAGALMDLSVRVGSWELDTSLNNALYGDWVAQEEILTGEVAPLPEFMPLYQLLNSLSMESGI